MIKNGGMIVSDNPRLRAAMRLLDAAKAQGFRFIRVAPGADGPLQGVRVGERWTDKIFIGGFSDGCHAVRTRRSSLIVTDASALVAAHVQGDAITVLGTVIEDWGVMDRAEQGHASPA
jgi:hypothetical protein